MVFTRTVPQKRRRQHYSWAEERDPNGREALKLLPEMQRQLSLTVAMSACEKRIPIWHEALQLLTELQSTHRSCVCMCQGY